MFQDVVLFGSEMHIAVAIDEEALRRLYPVRPKTILLVEGINELTGRPIRIYISPTDKLTCVETVSQGQLERA